MGSFGRGSWLPCYWCGYWVENPYLIDWIGKPLCNLCFEWHMGWGRFDLEELEDEAELKWARAVLAQYKWCPDQGGGPYEPCARTRYFHLLRRLRPLATPDRSQVQVNDAFFNEEICSMIAEFLVTWHEP